MAADDDGDEHFIHIALRNFPDWAKTLSLSDGGTVLLASGLMIFP